MATATEEARVRIPERFNGPPGSANGGYTCGLVAGLVDARCASVSLRAPPPLERELEVVRAAGRVELRDGETLVAEGAPAELELGVPADPGPERAAAASRAFAGQWAANHPFPTCVVCGPERLPEDGFGVFPGPLGEGEPFASVWTPSLRDATPECTWAALDCPTSAPVANFALEAPIVLARLTARIDRRPRAGEEHTIVSWPLARDGRKRRAGAAMYAPGGELAAVAEALWIEVR